MDFGISFRNGGYMNTELIEQAQRCYLTVLSGHVKSIDQGYGGYQNDDIKFLIDFINDTKKRLEILQLGLELRLEEEKVIHG